MATISERLDTIFNARCSGRFSGNSRIGSSLGKFFYLETLVKLDPYSVNFMPYYAYSAMKAAIQGQRRATYNPGESPVYYIITVVRTDSRASLSHLYNANTPMKVLERFITTNHNTVSSLIYTDKDGTSYYYYTYNGILFNSSYSIISALMTKFNVISPYNSLIELFVHSTFDDPISVYLRKHIDDITKSGYPSNIILAPKCPSTTIRWKPEIIMDANTRNCTSGNGVINELYSQRRDKILLFANSLLEAF